MAADLVVFGTVLTVDGTMPTAEALVVTGGRIVAVGDRGAVACHVGSDGIADIDVRATYLAGRRVSSP